jgi:hypothetical protein
LRAFNIRADYEKALCTFMTNTEINKGLGNERGTVIDDSKELTSAVYMKELSGRDEIDIGGSQKSILVGFEGYTDENK